jgi:hypothetical protein
MEDAKTPRRAESFKCPGLSGAIDDEALGAAVATAATPQPPSGRWAQPTSRSFERTISNAAPAGVYQSEHWDTSFYYKFTGLKVMGSCVVRLHFAEIYYRTTAPVRAERIVPECESSTLRSTERPP